MRHPRRLLPNCRWAVPESSGEFREQLRAGPEDWARLAIAPGSSPGQTLAIGVSMVGEKANSIAEVLAERLKGVRIDRPWVRGLSALVKMVGRDPVIAPASDITRRTRDHRRVLRTPWLWPCHWIPSIEAALTDPAPESCAVLEQFFLVEPAFGTFLPDGRSSMNRKRCSNTNTPSRSWH